jgi:hypothetical protein
MEAEAEVAAKVKNIMVDNNNIEVNNTVVKVNNLEDSNHTVDSKHSHFQIILMHKSELKLVIFTRNTIRITLVNWMKINSNLL